MTQTTRTPAEPGPTGVNEVVLVGRLAAAPTERILGSGDVLLTWRLIVNRPAPGQREPGQGRPVTVDTFDCAAWTAGVRRRVVGYGPGDVLRVEGALRRRFWRGGAGPVSAYQVEAQSVRRLSRAQASR